MNGLVTRTMTFLMLPHDLILNCLARVSRLYYPTLGLVSMKFRSLLALLVRYKIRTLLCCTESCLYVCLRFPGDSNIINWFTLCKRPNSNPEPRRFTCFAPYRCIKKCISKKEKKLSENVLVSIPTSSSHFVGRCSTLVAIGYNIYRIGGLINGVPSSRVVYMDCRSHTWHEAPSMRMGRKVPRVSVLDGKIYVVEGCINLDLSNRVECFGPKTQVWEHVPSPDAEICGIYILKSLAMEGKLYMVGNKSVVYGVKENRWDEVGFTEMQMSWIRGCCCVVDNVLYCYGLSNKLVWYDSEARTWRYLKGMEKLHELSKPCVMFDYTRLVDYGGKLAVLWEEDVARRKKIFGVLRFHLKGVTGKRRMERLSGATLYLQSQNHVISCILWLLPFDETTHEPLLQHGNSIVFSIC